MSSKLWASVFFMCAVLFFFFVVIWNFIFDPFSQIRDSGIYICCPDYHRYVNAGIIKNNHNYNAIILGTSYIANFNNDLIDKLFGVKSQTLSIFGGSQKEISITLDYALSKHPDLKMVFLETNI